MEFDLKLTKEDIESMLSEQFGHDVQLEHLVITMGNDNETTVFNFDEDYTYIAFLLTSRKAPKEVKYYDGNDYSMD